MKVRRYWLSHEEQTTNSRIEFYNRENVKLIIAMRKTLQLDGYRTEHIRKDLKEYGNLLQNQFKNDRRREKMDLRKFLDTETGKDWEGTGSMLLLLFGRNETGIGTHHSWLSPVAVELAETLFDSGDPVAYEGCRKSSTLEVGISRLIYQLLERNPALIKRAIDFQEIESQLSQTGDEEEKLEALRLALLRIINLHDQRIYIILDRPDVCSGSCLQYITMMLSLVKDATKELKIMIVQRSEIWDAEKHKRDIDTRGFDLSKFRRICMNQNLLFY